MLMPTKHIVSKLLHGLRVSMTSLAILNLVLAGPLQGLANAAENHHSHTRTPIKHLIVIIGENRSFDHVYATYKPRHGESVDNLLSKKIINADGTPGPRYAKAIAASATDSNPDPFLLAPTSKAAYSVLPIPLTDGAPTTPYVPTTAEAQLAETGLTASDSILLTTGATGLPSRVPDTRIANVSNLPPGPFQLTGPSLPYDSYTASPVHRFYQMWQQLDCNASAATRNNPSGCKADLFPYVEVTVGAGDNGMLPPSNFATDWASGAVTTGEGSTAMGFYNVQQGDAPYMKELADKYTLNDNFHQSIMGGTGANHIALGTGDAIYYSDGNGNALTPPHNQMVGGGVVDEIEDPNPAAGTNNWYTEDGYGAGGYGYGTPAGGGSYSDCSDPNQPGVAAVLNYLSSLKRPINPRCEPGHYYLLNNYNPGFYGDGTVADPNDPNYAPFTIPPSSVRTIGDELLEHKISWKYYGDQWNQYLTDKYQVNWGDFGVNSDEYCTICNPFQYATSIMANDAVRTAHIQDTLNLYADIASGTLPEVSFVKPSGFTDGHPASSKLNLFEAFTKKIVDMVKANPKLWSETAIMITFDEGGGYWDSGYVQPLDFFGDGTRIPLLIVSPYSRGGHVDHSYGDHVSILKFIEANWYMKPLTYRSRDNFPNPRVARSNPYVPLNTPALSDLMNSFDFGHGRDQ
jgi:phospholipase C